VASPAVAQTPPQSTDTDAEAPVQTQIDPDAQASQGTDSIVVTGSRIRRPDLTSTSPLTVVQDEEFQLSGSVNVEQVINTLPQVLPGVTGFSNNPGNGAVTLNLRNLGAARTLVLVNGRRWMFYDVSQIPDLNTIPQFMLESVDVVTGGASAVYGSDALGGVVNFRLRQNLQGIQAGATYGITSRGDGARYNFDVAVGSNFGDGRGNVTAYGSYTKREPVFQGARAFSRNAAGDNCIIPGSADSATRIGTVFPRPAGATPNSLNNCVSRGGEIGFTAGGSPTTPAGTLNALNPVQVFGAGGVIRPFVDPSDLYNFAPDNYLQLPQERYLVGAYGSYEITDAVRPFFEASFVNSVTAQELAPTPASVSAPLQIASPFFAPATRTFLQTLADPANPGYTTSLSVARRFNEVGARNSNQNRDAFRILGGLKGDITPTLNYEAFYSYSRTRNTQFQQGNISRSRFISALTTEFAPGTTTLRCRDAAARANGCVPLNVFGPDAISPAAAAYVSVDSTNQDVSDLKNIVASISGTAFNLGLGAPDIGFALGAEYRRPSSRYIPDELLSSGDVLGFNAGQPTKGSYNVKELFGELSVPILRDNIFAAAEINGGFRYSDYSLKNVGGVWSYFAGAEIAPIRDIRFRGQYQRAVRAPNISELFGGQSTGFPAATDPCSDRGTDRSDALRQLCIASGVPAANVFTRPVQPAAQIQGFFGGNPDLQEETSDTYTIGAVLSPRFLPRLNVTVDYFNIKVDQVIGTAGGGLNSALQLCYTVVRDLNSSVCQLFAGKRNAVTGAIGETQAGQNPLILNANNGALETSGIDIQADYNLPLNFSLFGRERSRVSFYVLGTYLDKFRFTALADIPERVTIGEGSLGFPSPAANSTTPLPKWRHTARLTLTDGPLTVSGRWRYLASVEDFRIKNTFNGLQRIGTDPQFLTTPKVPAVNYFDLTFGFDVTDKFSLNLGVNNLLDKQPKVLGSLAEQANTYPGTYDVLGRDFFVSTRLRF
jgi:outer membrane receptor protein involved in Fe transport